MLLFTCFLEYILFIFNIIISFFNDIYTIFNLIILNDEKNDIENNINKNINNDTNNDTNNDNIKKEFLYIKKEDYELHKYHTYFLKYNIYEIVNCYIHELINYRKIFIEEKNNNNKDLDIFVEYFIYILNNNYILFNNDIIEIFDDLINNNSSYKHDELKLFISSKKNILFNYLKKFDTFIHKWDKFDNILYCDKNNRNIMHHACLLNDINFIKGLLFTKAEYNKKDFFGYKPIQYLSSGVRNDLICT